MSLFGLNPRVIKCQCGEAGCLRPKHNTCGIMGAAGGTGMSAIQLHSITHFIHQGQKQHVRLLFLGHSVDHVLHQRLLWLQETENAEIHVCKKPHQINPETLVAWIMNKAKLFASRDLINQTI